jgi:Protein of unknown function (DUF2911)
MKTNYPFISLFSLMLLISCNQKQESKTETTQPITDKKIIEAVVIQQQSERDTLKGSLKALVTGKIGNIVVTINYYSPAVRGRVIWGGLVPMDQVWVTGAHKATTVEFEGPVKIGGVELPAGKYGLFTIPSKTEWTIIINKNWDQHLADEYDQKDDLLRIKVKPETEETHQERLRYAIESKSGNKGEIVIYWENIHISFLIGI